jgi:tight adherence protein B
MVADYDIYIFSFREKLRYILEGFVVALILGSIFYKSVIGNILLCPLIFPYYKRKRKELINKRKWQLNIEFRDGINSLSAALSAGYSAEQAFIEAVKDLRHIYPGGAMIIKEFTYLINQIQMNITVEKALSDFGERSRIEDIISFAEVFSTAKRTGGDIIQIIKTTGSLISDRLEIKREVITLIAAKKFEATIMKLVPAGILCYLWVTSPGLLDPLYHNLFGAIVMTVLLGIYLITYCVIDKIIAIEL